MKRLLMGTLCAYSITCFSQTYEDRALDRGIVHSYGDGYTGAGISLIDFNQDGLDDLTLATSEGSPIVFYENNGTSFTEVDLGIEDLTETKQILWVDYDNDGDQDLFVSSLFSTNSLYENTGGLNFVDATEEVGLPTIDVYAFGAAWGDYDKDGWLDLYVTTRGTEESDVWRNYMYKNNEGSFTEVSESSNCADKDKMPFQAIFFDYNNDGWEDIYVVHDLQFRSVLLENNKDGTYLDVGAETKSDLQIGGMGIAIGDFNNDGYFDIYNSNESNGNKLLKNIDGIEFEEIADDAGVGFYGWGWAVNFFDYDNDTYLDLYSSGGHPDSAEFNFNVFYKNLGSDNFETPVDIGLSGDTVMSFTHAIGDINNDGFPDIVSSNHAPHNTHVWMNSANANNWAKIDLEGTISNRDAIGSRVDYWIDGNRYLRSVHGGMGFLGQNARTLTLSLGTASQIDSLQITWPSGHVEKTFDILAGSVVDITEFDFSEVTNQITYSKGDCNSSNRVEAGLYGRGLSYQWSTGATMPVLDITQAGTYSLTVSGPGFEVTGSIDVQEEELYSPIELSLASTGASVNGFDGSATVNISGGTPPYQVAWNDPFLQTTETAAGLSTGLYTVSVLDSEGCIVSKSIIVELIAGIDDKSVVIYPNPTSSAIQVESISSIERITLTDASGVTLLTKSIDNTSHLELGIKSFAAGIYHLLLETTDGKLIRRKVVKLDK